jgi:hypothetical protein
MTTCPRSPKNPPSSNICGIWVDFPEPVGASITIRFVPVRNAFPNFSRISSMGKFDAILKP